MEIVRSVAQAREACRSLRARGERLAFVPTMGALHAGHLSLVALGRARAGAVVASVFVNPSQFGPAEDFAAYPRDLDRDASLLREAGVQVLFAPDAAEIYPPGFRTRVRVDGLSDVLIGAQRPGHFEGVATVVMKLLQIVQPDVAVFGWKDAQQLVIVQRLVRDLDVPVAIVGAPIVREPDGLAMSSRNVRLDARARAAAPAIHRALLAAGDRVTAGERSAATLLDGVRRDLADVPPLALETADVVRPEDLSPVERLDGDALLLITVRVKRDGHPDVLLLDNIRLAPSPDGTRRS